MALLHLLCVAATAQVAAEEASSWRGRIPSGTRVTFLAVNDDFHRVSWRPDGTRMRRWVRPEHLFGEALDKRYATRKAGGRTFLFRLNLSPLSKRRWKDEGPDCAFRIGDGPVTLSSHSWRERDGSWIVSTYTPVASPTQAIKVQIGLADDPWRTYTSRRFGPGLHPDDGRKAFIGVPHVLGGLTPMFTVRVVPPPAIAQRSMRAIAYDARGRVRQGRAWRSNSWIDFDFHGKPVGVQRVELRTRPYHWLRFKGARPQPAK